MGQTLHLEQTGRSCSHGFRRLILLKRLDF
jgi:hypothetical protein